MFFKSDDFAQRPQGRIAQRLQRLQAAESVIDDLQVLQGPARRRPRERPDEHLVPVGHRATWWRHHTAVHDDAGARPALDFPHQRRAPAKFKPIARSPSSHFTASFCLSGSNVIFHRELVQLLRESVTRFRRNRRERDNLEQYVLSRNY